MLRSMDYGRNRIPHYNVDIMNAATITVLSAIVIAATAAIAYIFRCRRTHTASDACSGCGLSAVCHKQQKA